MKKEKKESEKCWRYYEQQKAVDEIATKLGVVAYRRCDCAALHDGLGVR